MEMNSIAAHNRFSNENINSLWLRRCSNWTGFFLHIEVVRFIHVWGRKFEAELCACAWFTFYFDLTYCFVALLSVHVFVRIRVTFSIRTRIHWNRRTHYWIRLFHGSTRHSLTCCSWNWKTKIEEMLQSNHHNFTIQFPFEWIARSEADVMKQKKKHINWRCHFASHLSRGFPSSNKYI